LTDSRLSPEFHLKADLKGTTMADTPMPVTGFSMDAVESEDGQTMVAVLTLESGDFTFEFAINDDGAQAMVASLQQFLDMVQSRGDLATGNRLRGRRPVDGAPALGIRYKKRATRRWP
jgi:hypothetical protein